TLSFDGSSAAQAAGVSHSLEADRSQTGWSDHPTSSNSDGTVTQPTVLEQADVSPSTNCRSVSEQTETADSTHPKGNGPAATPAGTGTETHSILDVAFSTQNAFQPAADQHVDNGKAAESPGHASAADTESASDDSPLKGFEDDDGGHWTSRQES